jgi:hypothetical protein
MVSRELGDELLIYDLERHKAYCLNAFARQVLAHCDGQTAIDEITRRVGRVLGGAVSEDAVRLGLARLERARLLEVEGPRPVVDTSRRELLRRLAGVAAVVPLVTVLNVPTPAHAASALCNLSTGRLCGGFTGPCGKKCTKWCSGSAGSRCT